MNILDEIAQRRITADTQAFNQACANRGLFRANIVASTRELDAAVEWLEKVSIDKNYVDAVRLHATVLIKYIASM